MTTVCKWIAVVVGIIGFIIILGTVGASDAGTIGSEEELTRCALGIVMMIIGTFTAYKIEQKQNS